MMAAQVINLSSTLNLGLNVLQLFVLSEIARVHNISQAGWGIF
jgi:hypothetical protein